MHWIEQKWKEKKMESSKPLKQKKTTFNPLFYTSVQGKENLKCKPSGPGELRQDQRGKDHGEQHSLIPIACREPQIWQF
jgi:hypothetical protein